VELSRAPRARLEAALAAHGSLLVAFSGGVDSALLAVMAQLVLGPRALAVTADSPALADEQRQQALRLADEFGFSHRLVPTYELEQPGYVQNGADRCYYCKRELFATLGPLAATLGFARVAYGLILDDLDEPRPGRRAAEEAGAVMPLAEAGFSKRDVRELSRELGLPTAELPASPCLASRFPYGTPVSFEGLRRVERAEAGVKALGFRELRVRHLAEGAARVEVAPAELARLAEPRAQEAVRAAVGAAGFMSVEIDPQGYRRGRLNENP